MEGGPGNHFVEGFYRGVEMALPDFTADVHETVEVADIGRVRNALTPVLVVVADCVWIVQGMAELVRSGHETGLRRVAGDAIPRGVRLKNHGIKRDLLCLEHNKGTDAVVEVLSGRELNDRHGPLFLAQVPADVVVQRNGLAGETPGERRGPFHLDLVIAPPAPDFKVQSAVEGALLAVG